VSVCVCECMWVCVSVCVFVSGGVCKSEHVYVFVCRCVSWFFECVPVDYVWSRVCSVCVWKGLVSGCVHVCVF